jgi:phosphoglycerate dehydrogenase-like enzyme
MRPRILLLDEPHPKARAIMEEVAEAISKDCYIANKITEHESYWRGNEINLDNFDYVYTQLTPVNANIPVFCPCTGIDHIQAPKVIYLDDKWKATEGREVTSTAEHTFSLILQLAKLNRMQLKGKTLCIVGYGRIGRQVAKYAICFEMTVRILDNCDPYRYWILQKELFKESDIITLHVPLNEKTHGMIGEKEFAMMKSGALLVNTSRAEIVNEDALSNWLKSDDNNRYADDFYDSHSKEFQEYSGALMTRHIGGNCLEAREATDIYIAKKIVEYLSPKFTFEHNGL